jgi:uncharacterized protein with PIN domain
MLLVDGSIAAALVRGEPKMARAAREAARVLLAAAGVRVSASASTEGKRHLRRDAVRRGRGVAKAR